MHGDVDEMLVDAVLFACGVRLVASHRSCARPVVWLRKECLRAQLRRTRTIALCAEASVVS